MGEFPKVEDSGQVAKLSGLDQKIVSAAERVSTKFGEVASSIGGVAAGVLTQFHTTPEERQFAETARAGEPAFADRVK